MFEQTLLAKPRRNPWATLLSFVLDGLLLAALVIAPLLFTEALPQIMRAVEIGPPPAARPATEKQPPPEQRSASQQGQSNLVNGVLIEPDKIPPRIVRYKDRMTEGGPEPSGAVVIGGDPSATAPGTGIARFLESVTPLPPAPQPPPPAPEPMKRVRVGGDVQQARIVFQPTPVYPQLARTARISGTVRLAAVINEQGEIEELRVVDGHGLLIEAALQAVRQWRYKPLVLNGVPRKVDTTIDVYFKLN